MAMEDPKLVRGIVLKHYPVGEYDYAVTVFAADEGRISAFARGAKKPGSKLAGSVEPFCFGTFKLFVGKNSYTMVEADIENYFEGFRQDFEAAMYGSVLLEIAEYYTRENAEDKELLNLLYISLKALLNKSIPNRLVKCVYILRALVTEGEYPGEPQGFGLSHAAVHALGHITTSPLGKLYTFSVTEEVLMELERVTEHYVARFIDRPIKSMEMLEVL